MTVLLLTYPDGSEKISTAPEKTARVVTLKARQVADKPTKKFLATVPDGTWIRVGRRFYRNDDGMWCIGHMPANPAFRYNVVDHAYIVRVHAKQPVFLLEEL